MSRGPGTYAFRPSGALTLARRDQLVRWGGAALVLAVAAALYTRFSVDDWLRRDEAIYAYAGQQLAHGVAPYASIFDPKTPLAGMIAGLGALLAKRLGADDVHTIRVVFLVFSCVAVGGVYLLSLGLWQAPVAAIVSAVAFTAFPGFAVDAVGGPDAKTPGIAFAVLSMAALVRRRWLWGALAGSLALLVWQPLGVYTVVAVVAALAMSEPGRRLRHAGLALVGVAVPIAATTLYFWLAGALGKLWEAAVRFPLTGIVRGHQTFADRMRLIVRTIHDHYGTGGWLLAAGLIALVALVVLRVARRGGSARRAAGDPLVWVVAPTFLLLAAFTASDFQGYPDVYPLLPYGAIGAGGAVFAISRTRWRTAVRTLALAAAAVLFVVAWSTYSIQHPRNTELVVQRAEAAEIQRLLDPGERLYAIGSPTPLVLTGRRNPSRFIYLGSGIGQWVIHHTPGGFHGWTRRIRATHPALIAFGGWTGPNARRMLRWLRSHYAMRRVRESRLFMPPRLAARARRRGVRFGRPSGCGKCAPAPGHARTARPSAGSAHARARGRGGRR